MPMLIKNIDAIAREKQRDVLCICFHPKNWRQYENETCLDWQAYNYNRDARREEVLAWLDEHHIPWQKCGPVASETRFRRYLGEIYIDVPFDENDPQYQLVRNYLENPDGTMWDEHVCFCYLSLEHAMRNAHHDEPGFWEKWADNLLIDWRVRSKDLNSVHSEDPVIYHAAGLPSVIFAHGKESGPWGEKIVAMAQVAKGHGLAVESPDFRGMDNPEERVKHLLQVVSGMQGPFILVGSSMGGYVALRASRKLPTLGLFLLAPAVGLNGYRVPRPVPGSKRVTIIHAWQDEIIPVNNVIDYAGRHHAELHLVNSDHRLSGQIPLLVHLFDGFLR